MFNNKRVYATNCNHGWIWGIVLIYKWMVSYIDVKWLNFIPYLISVKPRLTLVVVFKEAPTTMKPLTHYLRKGG